MIDPKELSIWREAFKKTGAIEIGNIFSQQTKSYIKGSAKLLYNKFNWEENFKNFNVKHSEKNSLYCKSMYCCHLGESILSFLTPLYSKISQKKLIPTYSYFRQYRKGASLVPHVDRGSCQYSATLQIDTSKNEVWPISFYNKDRQIISSKGGIFSLAFYKGEEVLHWREPLPYEYSTHLFLHWIDGSDPIYKDFAYDCREGIFSESTKDSIEKRKIANKKHSEFIFQKQFGSPK